MNFTSQFLLNKSLATFPFGFWLLPLISWSLIWKGLALWKASRNNQLYWFIALLALNTAGLLPILYLTIFQKETKPKSK